MHVAHSLISELHAAVVLSGHVLQRVLVKILMLSVLDAQYALLLLVKVCLN